MPAKFNCVHERLWWEIHNQRVKRKSRSVYILQGHQQYREYDFPQELLQTRPIRKLLLGQNHAIIRGGALPSQFPCLVKHYFPSVHYMRGVILAQRCAKLLELINGFLFKIDSLRFFVSCVDNNAFVYYPEEDCTEVNVQFGIFSVRRHLRQSGSFPVDKDKWRSEFPDGLFSKESVAGSSDTLSIEPAGDIWLFANWYKRTFLAVHSYYDNANSFYDNQADLRVKAMTVLLFRLNINAKKAYLKKRIINTCMHCMNTLL